MDAAERNGEATLPPLDRIRQAEIEVARQVAFAREAAEQTVRTARTKAATLRREADAVCRHGEHEEHRQAVSQAQMETKALKEAAERQAHELQRTGEVLLEDAVQRAFALVMGLAQDEP